MKYLQAVVAEGLKDAAPDRHKIEFRTDVKGVTTAWCVLDEKDDLLAVARFLAEGSARLSTITAYSTEKAKRTGNFEIAYHFDLDGDTLTVSVHVPPDGEVDSITSLFDNADWPEREMAELYGIKLRGHPHPERLFIDESLGDAVFDQYIPYSTMVNAATTKGLWEKVIAKGKGKGEGTP
ncbi:NADH-quinone oxidoreductase subunit C [Telmatospirillum siberiense]|uniref:NADH dehydrogenase subunit n=1 Tax=Telmatospirillum siberiense TaxID=382514 RepID=A0A2N3PWZ9_9PROT|nr:NADH-quinone oxidoreductase subunit C [Telmatospirillum siberiense]PKU24930.1 NADH dehydrogenase subunit [Telmatospirillum siberiense]